MTIIPAGGTTCKAHRDPTVLERDRKNAAVKRANKEQRKPTESYWWTEEWYKLDRPIKEWAERSGKHYATAAKNYAWQEAENDKEAARAVWVAPRPEGIPESHYDLTPEHIPVLIEDFLRWRAKYLKTPRRDRYVTPEFQVKWATAILTSLVTGGRQLILSPPRHGKSELLAHIVIYLVCLFPNLRVLWVAVAERIARESVGLMSRILANNEELIADFAGPERSFRPTSKDGLSWSANKFTVATRTATDIAGPTVMAIGRGGSLLSLNADLLVVDDLEDEGSTSQEGTRQGTREWWVSQLESRKEAHTGLFVIGSRQHHDDLYAHLLESAEFESIIEVAHDPTCDIPETPGSYDLHQTCVLFPELRSFEWLAIQKAAASGVSAHIWDMVYQNMPLSKGMMVFTPETVYQCRVPSLSVGQIPSVKLGGVDPSGTGVRLVAGLDPAGVGYQASVLLAYQAAPELRIWVVDLENRQGGGVGPAMDVITRWHKQYDLSHWVVESNLADGFITADKEVTAYKTEHGIRIEDFQTTRNKHDPRQGITALAPLFANKQVQIPYSEGSQEKMDQLCKQLILLERR